jgi:hypothetical protein
MGPALRRGQLNAALGARFRQLALGRLPETAWAQSPRHATPRASPIATNWTACGVRSTPSALSKLKFRGRTPARRRWRRSRPSAQRSRRPRRRPSGSTRKISP